MGFNEPDQQTQSNMTPEQAAEAWREIEQYYQNAKLVSPSPLDISWLDDWWDAYFARFGRSPRIHAVAGHFYGFSDGAQAYKNAVRHLDELSNFAKRKGVEAIWITELAQLPCYSDQADTATFIERIVPVYKQCELVTRIAWFQVTMQGDEPWGFGAMCNTSLVNWTTGDLTVIGHAYKDAMQ